MKARRLLEAAGAALLFMMPHFSDFLIPGHLALYHHKFPLNHLIGGLLLDLLGFFLLGAVLLALVARLRPFPRRVAAAFLAGACIWRLAGNVFTWVVLQSQGQDASLTGIHHLFSPSWIVLNWGRYTYPILVTTVMLLAAFAWVRPATTLPVVRTVRLGLGAFAFCLLWVIPQIVYVGFGVRGVPSFDHSSVQAQSSPSTKRIVWILFDELSYDLLFEHPPRGEQFANFQRLHSESTSFGNIEPVGFFTDRIIPSLLANRRIDEINSTMDGKLLNLDPSGNQWVAYDPKETLFRQAQSDGWNPGVAGWYNPYCRIFFAELTACSWKADQALDPFELMGASEDQSVLSNSMVLPRAYYAALSSSTSTAKADRAQHILDYRSVTQRAQDLIQEGQIHFLFLHLPVPHPPGIYDRDAHRFREGGNYLDNLMLADDTLGVLMRQIEHTPWADSTTVIVSSDHSWRIPIWRNYPDWTPEEERVSHGKFDPRPVFLVHFPGQKSSQEISTKTQELEEHDIIESMLRGSIENPQDLGAFLLSTDRRNAEHAALSREMKSAH